MPTSSSGCVHDGDGHAWCDPHASLRVAVTQAATMLRDAGVEVPEHDAAVLFAHVLGGTLADLRTGMAMGRTMAEYGAQVSSMEGLQHDESAAATMLSEVVRRRCAREPLQHIVGHAPFRYLDVAVGPGVFVPRPETEMAVDLALDWIGEQSLEAPCVVDYCAGSGVIGLSVAVECAHSEVWAVELSDEALPWTRRNAERVADSHPSVRGRYHLVQGDALAPDTLGELRGKVDVVVTNPPYVPNSAVPEQPEVRLYDPAMALYGGSDDGLLFPERLMVRAASMLRLGGLLVMEHDISQGEALVSWALEHGFARAHTVADWAGRPRFVVACRRMSCG